MTKNLFLTITLLWFVFCFGQDKISITGKVLDAENNEPLSFVSVSVQNSNYGTITNEKGQFKLILKEKVAQVTFSYLGYKTKVIDLKNLSSNNQVVISLNPYKESLEEVIVTNKPLNEILKDVVETSRSQVKETAILTSYNREILKTDDDYCFFADGIFKYHIKGKKKKMRSKLELKSSRVKEGNCEGMEKFIKKSPLGYDLKDFNEAYFGISLPNLMLNRVTKSNTGKYVFKLKTTHYDNRKVNKIEFRPNDNVDLKGLDAKGYVIYDAKTKLILETNIEKASSKKEDASEVNIFILKGSTIDYKQKYSFRFIDGTYTLSYIKEYKKYYLNNIWTTKYDKTFSFFADLTTLNYEPKVPEYKFDKYRDDFIYQNGNQYETKFWENVSMTTSSEEENFNEYMSKKLKN